MTQNSIPIFGKPSFSCPHCGAKAHQDWYLLGAGQYDKEHAPYIPDARIIEKIQRNLDIEADEKIRLIGLTNRIRGGEVFLESVNSLYFNKSVHNLSLSCCFSCGQLAVWLHDRIVFPTYVFEIPPNADLPDEIKADFMEAMKILEDSPRGSAALLRLLTCPCVFPPRGIRVRPSEGRTDEASKVH